MKYYFVSYNYIDRKDSGVGRLFFQWNGPFILETIEKTIADEIRHEQVLISYYKEITKEEFKLNS